MMNNKVLIMLSTYNGQKYLREQLDSLYAQKGVDIHILVRDDGSKDDTLKILNEYKHEYGKMTINTGDNIGAARSFFQLIVYARKDFNNYDYYAFCDQDDVWYDNKLSYSIEKLVELKGIYKLFYSNVIVTDSCLRPVKHFMPSLPNTLATNILGNEQLGCTQVFNYQLFEKISHGAMSAQVVFDYYWPLHDVWTSLVAFAYNADIIYGSEPTMSYRQHDANVVGNKNKGLIRTCIYRFKRLFTYTNAKSMKCEYILKIYDDIPNESKDILKKCADYKKNGIHGRVKFAFNKLYHPKDNFKKMGYIVAVLMGKF